jgi:hypothetical protein
MFSLVCTLSSPTSAEDRAPLFSRFTVTTVQSDPSRPCMAAVRRSAFAARSRSYRDRGGLDVSRFSCMLLLGVQRVFDYAGPTSHSRLTRPVVLPSPSGEWGRRPGGNFRSSIAPPADALVYASSVISRCRPQDSGSGWSRLLLSHRALASPATCRFIPAHL